MKDLKSDGEEEISIANGSDDETTDTRSPSPDANLLLPVSTKPSPVLLKGMFDTSNGVDGVSSLAINPPQRVYSRRIVM